MYKFLVPLFFVSLFSWAQPDPVKWSFELEAVGNAEYVLRFKASIVEKWHLYGQDLPEDGPLPTVFLFEGEGYNRLGPVTESEPITAFDPIFEMELQYFDGQATFEQRIKVTDPTRTQISGEIEYQACDDKLCIFRTEPFTFSLDGKSEAAEKSIDAASSAKAAALKIDLKNTAAYAPAQQQVQDGGLLTLFLLGMFGGFLALLTPCVFPMIPLTVSYFVKQQGPKGRGTLKALLYGFFIVLIYFLLSLPFHFLEGLSPQILNQLATNVVINTVLFIVFVVFAFSFFGYFELTLPSKWSQRTDEASQWKGVIGIFFMALTLALVSFSCTGPILGALLAGSISSTQGALQLSFGMLGFGLALGLPFALFALFPKTLDRLPKSGGWMTTLKVGLGFLELALALKFLSNADLVGHWGLLKREVFVGIWLLLSLLFCLYLFGVYRFQHEGKGGISATRKGFGVLMALFSLYLLQGLWAEDNRLKFLSGFPPPEFYSLKDTANDCPLGLDCYKDYETGKAVAEENNKPILLDFTGWACVNCRKMEENIWSAPEVFQLMDKELVLVSLYVDDRTPLPKKEQFKFEQSNGAVITINTIGKKWASFQLLNFQSASQPFYVLLTPDGRLLNTPIQYTDKETFYNWLKTGLNRHFD